MSERNPFSRGGFTVTGRIYPPPGGPGASRRWEDFRLSVTARPRIGASRAVGRCLSLSSHACILFDAFSNKESAKVFLFGGWRDALTRHSLVARRRLQRWTLLPAHCAVGAH